MGINASRSLSNVTNRIDQSLKLNARATSNINCNANVGAIRIGTNRRCNIITENRCGASASASIDAIASAAAQALNEASTEQKTLLLPGFNFNDSSLNTTNEIKRRLSAKCESDAIVANEIGIGDIWMETCEDADIRNINAGNASANCAMRTIMNDVLNAQNIIDNKQTTGEVNLGNILGFGNLGQSGSLISVISCFSIICIFLIIILVLGFQFINTGGVESVASAASPIPKI